MKEGLLKDAFESIIKERQTVITIFYLIAVGVGMLFSNEKYSEFGINIFDYADILDFLIEPFSDFRILLFSILSITIVSLLFFLDTFWKIKHAKSYSIFTFGWDRKKWFNSFRYLLLIVGSIIYLHSAADIYGSISKKQINKQPTISLKFSDNEVITGIVIRKTKDIIFLLNNEKVKAIPIGSLVKEFEIK
jgi:hypothetical protein